MGIDQPKQLQEVRAVVAGRFARLPEPVPESVVHPSRAVSMPTDAAKALHPAFDTETLRGIPPARL
jgi:hypothetical protein